MSSRCYSRQNPNIQTLKRGPIYLVRTVWLTIDLNAFPGRMDRLRIEKVGDVHRTYAHLDVFQEAATSPFLEISITEQKALCFTFYPLAEALTLSQGEIEQILAVAQDFLPKSTANEESFRRWFQDEGPGEGRNSQ